MVISRQDLGHFDHAAILQRCLEHAEMTYLRSLGAMKDPVIELARLDRSDPHRIDISLYERDELIAAFERSNRGVAECLRKTRDPANPFTIVIATFEGVTVLNRANPA